MIIDSVRCAGLVVVGLGLVGLAMASGPGPGSDGPPAPSRPRPGLTARQAKEAVKLAEGTMVELRKKTEGASAPGADLREFVVAIEVLARNEPASPEAKRAPGDGDGDGPAAKARPPEGKAAEQEAGKDSDVAPGLRAIVTSYRYFDDITVFSTVDLQTGRVVNVEAAQHLRTPLSESEFELAQEMAREKSEEVKRLYERFGDELSVYPQFSQFTEKDDPRIHRVVHLNYRVGKRDLSYPRPQVDLTTRQVEVPPAPRPEPEPKPRRRTP